MKVMVMVKAAPSSEAGHLPSQELMDAMGQFNQALVEAGIMVSGDGLKPSKDGYRIRFNGRERVVTRGPFAETNELVAGYWVWNVASMDEALEWAKRCPNPMEESSEIEIRTFYEMDDFAEADPDGAFRAHEEGLRNEIALQQSDLNMYVFFGGRCEEALNFYRTRVGAKVGMMLRFSESPEPAPEGLLPAGFENKIMHAEFSIGQVKVLASDGCDTTTSRDGFRLALTVQTAEDAHRIFNALADGGSVDMPLSKTFWSPLYGQVTDPFGLGWMVMLPTQPIA